MNKRYEYSLDLADLDHLSSPLSGDDLHIRAPQPADGDALAELMMAAYQGTIDYDGETLADAIVEVQAYLAGESVGPALLDESRIAYAGSHLVGACLVTGWSARQSPIVAYAMTHADWKRRGVSKRLLGEVLRALHTLGHHKVWAVITEGNVASERLFEGLGFRRVSTT